MAMSPSVLIACSQLAQGGGLQQNPDLTSIVSSVNSQPLVSSLGALKTGTLASLCPLSSLNLPDFMANASTYTASITSQANQMLPANPDGTHDISKFSSILGGASAFGAASAEWNATMMEFQSKKFGDLGINVSNFSSVASNGMSNMFSGVADFTKQVGGFVAGAADTVKAKMSALGSAMPGLGSMFDPTQLNKLGDPGATILNLQKQGLGDVGGINDKLSAAGIDPTDAKAIANADPAQLKQIMSTVQGSDLQKIVSQTGLKIPSTGSVTDLSHVLDVSRILPASALAAIPGGAAGGFAALSNTFTNMGGQFKSFGDLNNMMGSMQTPSLPNLDGLTQLVPPSVASAFKPLLGSGSGPLGNPRVNDMIGTVTGETHTAALGTMNSALTNVTSSAPGSALMSSITALQGAVSAYTGDPTLIASDPTVAAAVAAVQSSASSFNSYAASNDQLKMLVAGANEAAGQTSNQLKMENSNLSLAGVDITAAAPKGITGVLGMAKGLHSMGIDEQQLGFGDMFAKLTTNDIGGDAIHSALLEGKNLARQAKGSVSIPTMANPQQTLENISPPSA
jgi:hypothetical protein